MMSSSSSALRCASSSRPRAVVALALLATVALASSACGIFGSDDPVAAAPLSPDAGDTVVKAPPVDGTATQSELTDALGVFVASTGHDSADGSHERPLATIQAGIDRAKTVGKRVYVCAGTYKESLVLADSISVIGGLDCAGNDWRTGSGVSRVESPRSPAILAKDLTSATRLEGLDVTAPSATLPGDSSLGILAYRAAGLVIAHTKITAGNAMKGEDGAEGAPLSNAPTANGFEAGGSIDCNAKFYNCERLVGSNAWTRPSGGGGGTNECVGAPGFTAEAGSTGGGGGLFEAFFDPQIPGTNYRAYMGGGYAETTAAARSGASGASGADGQSAPGPGTLSSDGFTPASGTAGSNGATGFGGRGGDGWGSPATDRGQAVIGHIYRGYGGAGGGAGGCPGLAGSPGKGGGASFAALLVESPITFDGVELTSGIGGAGGLGTFGSAPTAGGAAGANNTGIPNLTANAGGNGGAAGVSGNGASGPSAAIAHTGGAPKQVGANKLTPGAGGPPVGARSRDALGVTKTIPATVAGASMDILAF
jgi:hypothetical protein